MRKNLISKLIFYAFNVFTCVTYIQAAPLYQLHKSAFEQFDVPNVNLFLKHNKKKTHVSLIDHSETDFGI